MRWWCLYAVRSSSALQVRGRLFVTICIHQYTRSYRVDHLSWGHEGWASFRSFIIDVENPAPRGIFLTEWRTNSQRTYSASRGLEAIVLHTSTRVNTTQGGLSHSWFSGGAGRSRAMRTNKFPSVVTRLFRTLLVCSWFVTCFTCLLFLPLKKLAPSWKSNLEF